MKNSAIFQPATLSIFFPTYHMCYILCATHLWQYFEDHTCTVAGVVAALLTMVYARSCYYMIIFFEKIRDIIGALLFGLTYGMIPWFVSGVFFMDITLIYIGVFMAFMCISLYSRSVQLWLSYVCPTIIRIYGKR
jgi:hypothetical protein